MIKPVFATALKDLRLLAKDPGALAILFIMPLVFIVVMSLAMARVFQPSANAVVVAVADEDHGAFATELVRELRATWVRRHHAMAGQTARPSIGGKPDRGASPANGGRHPGGIERGAANCRHRPGSRNHPGGRPIALAAGSGAGAGSIGRFCPTIGLPVDCHHRYRPDVQTFDRQRRVGPGESCA